MSVVFSSFVGVDTSSGKRPFTYVSLDADLHLQAVGGGDGVDVLSYVAGLSSALVAVSTPVHAGHARLSISDSQRVLVQSRLSSLRQLSFDLTQPDSPSPSANPSSGTGMAACLGLVTQMESMSFHFFPNDESPRQWLETQADAGFWGLLGFAPFTSGSLEGRIQRQLVLDDLDLHVPDAMEFFEEITRYKLLHGVLPTDDILPQVELNAWLAAFTAWQAASQPEQVHISGESEHSPVYLPQKPS